MDIDGFLVEAKGAGIREAFLFRATDSLRLIQSDCRGLVPARGVLAANAPPTRVLSRSGGNHRNSHIPVCLHTRLGSFQGSDRTR